jgi:hypothetical protein
MLHCLSTEGFPRAHNLPQEGFGIQFGCLLWGPRDDISDMKRTLGKVTKTPNVWTRWKYVYVDRQRIIHVELWIKFYANVDSQVCINQ